MKRGRPLRSLTITAEVANQMQVTRQTLGRWRNRFLKKRLDGLLDEPRPGAPRQITDEHVERVVTMTLQRTPQDATHWSTCSMAKACGLVPRKAKPLPPGWW